MRKAFLIGTSRCAADERGEFHGLPLVLTTARTSTSLGATDWALAGGVTISIIPCVGIYLLVQRYCVAGFLGGAIK
jgi:multiple sugar transport system permease protein